ncbi:MAG: ferrous iron transport protein B [Myxococcales bacterium]|nr:MAG: ferrous iron transport protein B [Myxococcales bacterium]
MASSFVAPTMRTVAVAGNPNSGKTTLFNALTGSNAKIGNYPGVTIERRTGSMRLESLGRVEFVDVPGTYSLRARSLDEEAAINELLGRKGLSRPDAVILVLDATALERNLFLLMQCLEFDLPVIAAVNMMDLAKRRGLRIDFKALQSIFKIPFIPITAREREGLGALKQALETCLANPAAHPTPGWLWEPCPPLARDLDAFSAILDGEIRDGLKTVGARRAYALWMLMSLTADSEIPAPAAIRELTRSTQRHIADAGRDLDQEVIVARYAFIDRHAPLFIDRQAERKKHRSDRIDAILTHPVWGLLVFVFVMAVVFQALFSWSEPLIGFIESGFSGLADIFRRILPPSVGRDLLTDGVIAGVGGVLVFLPQILLLFFFLGVLEGTGYLARAAFLIDRLMRKVGLHGQAFVPMLSGYACAIPAIMATRTIEHRRDRMLTLMVIPLMSCSARLPVYTLIIALLFPAAEKIGPLSVGTLMLLGIYVIGTVLALIAAGVLGRTVLKGQPQPLLLELPSYRLPDPKSVLMTLVERAKVFLTTAGTIILLVTILLWALLSFPGDAPAAKELETQTALAESKGDAERAVALSRQAQAERLRSSYAGEIGRWLEPAIEPLGFDWKIGIGLVGAFAAREVFVSTMGVVYGVGEEASEADEGLRDVMRRDKRPDGSPLWTPLVGMSLLVFFMIAMQCVSTLAIVRRETKSWGWTAFMLAYLTTAAYLASLAVYQGGKLLGFE